MVRILETLLTGFLYGFAGYFGWLLAGIVHHAIH